ncbi:MAG: HAMP domain-containing histidine kinase [Cyclobacteriaceae bacterium]|nr:HAMP domain-containing histidine kinase [Cyclobacteriaceae bacterium]
MKKLTEQQIIEALSERFDQNKQAIEEQERLMEQLEQVNKKLMESESVKSQFLSNIRNEINNPLSSILGLADKLSHKPGDKEQVMYTSALIHQEAFSLDFQLRNIFTAAELEAGELQPSFGKVNVYSLVEGVIKKFDHLITKKGLSVEFKCTENLEFVTDAGMLSSIIRNLVSNGIEFNKDGGKLILEVSVEGGKKLKINVIDTGIGMNESDYNIIFDRFVQLETGVTKSHSGHGLGLTVTKAQVELMQGSVSVECIIGEGCSIGVSIPLAEKDDMHTFSDSGNVFFFDDEDEGEGEVF